MILNDFNSKKLSALGLGCMRLPLEDKDSGRIDETASAEMLDYAIKNGINYFDTAWAYHNGNSETVMGKLLQKYPRDSFYLASKFPGYDLSSFGKAEEIFEKQLQKCRVDHFDFYLFHNVCEMNIDAYLDKENGVYDYLIKQKKNGRIKHLGFSTHGTLETVKRFIDAYGDAIEFCQIQLNWLDWYFQSADEKVELLNKKNIPIWVMEPVRGGRLLSLPESSKQRLSALHPDWTLAEWAFRFLQSIDGVCVTLSGMSNMKQLSENIETYKDIKRLSDEDMSTLLDIAHRMTAKNTVPCTACSYCTAYCPKGLDIPRLIELYNEHSYSGGGFIAPMALSALEDGKKPSACVGCKSCEKVCPQRIKISEVMSNFSKMIK